MAFYFFVTYAVLVVTFYASFLIDDYKIDSSFSGVLISLFFLAIMLPGLFIDKIIRSLKRNVNLVALVLVCVGLLCVGVFHGKAMLAFGALCTGLGYGIMQPVIYDKAATIAAFRYAGPFVRHVGELPGRDGLPFYRRPLPSCFRDAQRPLPLLFQCGTGAGRGCCHTPAPGQLYARTRRILLPELLILPFFKLSKL